MTTCAICERKPATEVLGDLRICRSCLHLAQDEADRRLRIIVQAMTEIHEREDAA